MGRNGKNFYYYHYIKKKKNNNNDKFDDEEKDKEKDKYRDKDKEREKEDKKNKEFVGFRINKPLRLRIVSISDDSISLEWNCPEFDADRYQVFMRIGGQNKA